MNQRKKVREEVHIMLDNDEISQEEAGFMLGYYN